MVVIPCVEELIEKLQRIYRKHNIHDVIKQHNTSKNLLVHPKDKRDICQACGVLYAVCCKGCDKSFVDEKVRPFGDRAKKVENKKYIHKNYPKEVNILG